MELGICTFGDIGIDGQGADGGPRRRMQDLLEQAALADQVGLDVFAVGEHHRSDYIVSAPAVVLAAVAARSTRLRLTSAVTVLSSDDPVRVFEEFASLDLISNGRAEIMAGRGSFTESFPLFGYDLNLYDALFAEKLELLLKLRETARITWSGQYRPAIADMGVYPRPVQTPLPVWIAVGGTPASVERAGRLGLPLALAIIGGRPDQFVPLIALYRTAARRAGHDPDTLPLAINTIGFIADTSQAAADIAYPPYAEVMTRIGRERGWSGMNRAAFDALRSPQGALHVGSPQEVVDKILFEHEMFHHTRHLLQMSVGTVPHRDVLRAIELFGTVVAPAVRKSVGQPA